MLNKAYEGSNGFGVGTMVGLSAAVLDLATDIFVDTLIG